MTRNLFVLLSLIAVLLAACGSVETLPAEGTPGPGAPGDPVVSPYAPAPGDEDLTRGEVFIERKQVLVLESFAPQYVLNLSGSLPTPCHQLRVEVGEPNQQNQVQVEVYSLVDPDEVCIQVLEPFEAEIQLGSFAEGDFTIFVNGEQVDVLGPS